MTLCHRVILPAVGLMVVASTTWCFATLSQPGRLIFLPFGDVGLGFRSFAGRLQWIEYAPWDPKNMDHPLLSLPWWLIIPTEVLFCALLVRCICRQNLVQEGN